MGVLGNDIKTARCQNTGGTLIRWRLHLTIFPLPFHALAILAMFGYPSGNR